MISTLFHVTPAKAWIESDGPLRPESIDEVGYVHCSFAYQVGYVLRRYFAPDDRVVILEIDVSRLSAPVHLEPGDGGEVDEEGVPELYPHIFGEIDRDAVRYAHRRDRFAPLEVELTGALAGYRISDDRVRFDTDAAVRYLREESYWAKGRTRQAIVASFANSWVVGAYAPDGTLAGMGRAVSDWSTMWYLADLFVFPPHRERGLASAIVRAFIDDPRLEPLSGLLLTADAHGLYERFGFSQSPDVQGRFMRRPRKEFDK